MYRNAQLDSLIAEFVSRLNPVIDGLVAERADRSSRLNDSHFYPALSRILNRTANVFLVVDLMPAPRLRYVSSSIEGVLGYAPNELPSTPEPFFDLIHPADQARFAASREQRLGGDSTQVFRCVRKDGAVIAVELRSWPVVGPDGTIVSIESVLSDVTSRRDSPAASERVRAISEFSTNAIFIKDVEGKVLYVSPSTRRVFGLTTQEIKTPAELMHPDDALEHSLAFKAAAQTPGAGSQHEFRMRHGDGSWRWFACIMNNLIEDPSVRAIVSCYYDISDLKTTEANLLGARAEQERLLKELRAAEAMYRRIVETMSEGVWMMDRETTVTFVSPRLCEMFGYEADIIVGKRLTSVLPRPSVGIAAGSLERLLQGEPGQYELKLKRKDGTELRAFLSANRLVNEAGEIEGALGTVTDTTERYQVEERLRQLEEQLQQAAKMEAIGQLAGGVAHDFNNLLSVILSYGHVLRKGLSTSDPMADDLDEIIVASKRAADLTQQLLAFSRRQILQPRVIDVGHVVRGMERMIRRLIGENIDVLLSTDRGGRVLADPTQIEQILLNLVVNARDAMSRDGGRLTIETTPVLLDGAYADEHVSVTPGPYVMLAVTDTGIGMDKETKNRIFEPFFSTKDEKGTGLGLSTVYGIVKQSHGFIWVYSEPDAGTTFKIYFPEISADIDATPEPRLPSETLSGNETILLVEDEDQVRAVTGMLLRRSGYRVLLARNPGEAIVISEQHKTPIHLMLTDVIMPGMTGRQLAERLSKSRPDMRIVYMSGYTDNSIVHHGVLEPNIAFIQKPITPDIMLRKIRDVLNASSAPSR